MTEEERIRLQRAKHLACVERDLELAAELVDDANLHIMHAWHQSVPSAGVPRDLQKEVSEVQAALTRLRERFGYKP